MSNANQIHLLSLSASTLGHLVSEGFPEAKEALSMVLANIKSLTSASNVAKAEQLESPKYANDEVRASAGTDPELGVNTACGCGDPSCALIDTLLGNRIDYTVTGLVEEFHSDLGLEATAAVVLKTLDRIKAGLANGEIADTSELQARLTVVGDLGKKYAVQKASEFLKNAEVVRVESFDQLLDTIFGKKTPRP